MSIITTVKHKILINCILARILPPARIQGQKVVLARKIEKQGLGSPPVLITHCLFSSVPPLAFPALGRCWRWRLPVLESDPVKESLVADAPVATIWIIDTAFKHSSIRCLIPPLPSHLSIVELSVVARPVRPGEGALTMHFTLHKLSHVSPTARDLQSCLRSMR